MTILKVAQKAWLIFGLVKEGQSVAKSFNKIPNLVTLQATKE